MATPEITSSGIVIETFEEIFARLQDEYRTIYGADINVDQDSPDGQKIGIEAKAILDLQEYAVSLYNSFDPDLAVGLELDKILKLSGLTRRPATKSTVSINITASTTVDLPSDYTIADTTSQNWVIVTAQTITAGVTAVEFESQDWGAIEASANTITDPVTIILGVDSVTNPLAAEPGVNEETTLEVRQRRRKSIENPSYSTIGDLYSRLFQLNGITDVIIYENETDLYDATRDIDAHTIWTIIDGGSNADITEAIIKSKTGGTGLKGTVTGTFTEEFTRPNGTIRTYVHDAKFDRPTETDIYIKFDVTKTDTSLIDTQAIKDALVGRLFTIAEDAIVTSLYATIYSAGSNFIASSLQLSKDDITYVSGVLDADFDEKFVITDAQITITEI